MKRGQKRKKGKDDQDPRQGPVEEDHPLVGKHLPHEKGLDEAHFPDGPENETQRDGAGMEFEALEGVADDPQGEHDVNIGDVVPDGVGADDGEEEDDRREKPDGDPNDRLVEEPSRDDPHGKHENRGDEEGHDEGEDDFRVHGEEFRPRPETMDEEHPVENGVRRGSWDAQGDEGNDPSPDDGVVGGLGGDDAVHFSCPEFFRRLGNPDGLVISHQVRHAPPAPGRIPTTVPMMEDRRRFPCLLMTSTNVLRRRPLRCSVSAMWKVFCRSVTMVRTSGMQKKPMRATMSSMPPWRG